MKTIHKNVDKILANIILSAVTYNVDSQIFWEGLGEIKSRLKNVKMGWSLYISMYFHGYRKQDHGDAH